MNPKTETGVNIRKMVFVCNGHNPSSIRWALEYLKDALIRGGTNVSIVDLGRGGKSSDCFGADVVMIYRCVDEKTFKLMGELKAKGSFVLYFLDDYIFQTNCKYGGTVKDWLAPVPFMNETNCSVSSSAYLLSKMQGKLKILRKTVLGPDGMKFAKQEYRRNRAIFSIGWTAGTGRKNWMDGLVAQSLQEVDNGLKPGEVFAFHYFGMKKFPAYKNVKVVGHECVPTEKWMEWYSKLKELDLGAVINPLEENDEWCHCKSGLKFVEAGAMGVPLVTSRVKPYTEFIMDGVNGFLASTPVEFAEKMLLLMRNDVLSRKVSYEVRKQVETDYDVDRNATKFLNDVREAMRLAGR
jgi:glycosyltransferase involved in cell wall biosynthesis